MTIEVKGINKSFKNEEVIKNLSIKFKNGKIYGLVGRNGSGKSVFLKMICGFYKPDSGCILFDNINYFEKGKFPPNLRALIEKPRFLSDLTGFENLKELASIQNKIGDSQIVDMLKLLDMEECMNKKYKSYSLGMKQKLGIVQVLMENPEIIILDEPFNGIDSITVEKIKNILLNEKKKGKLIIISSHIFDDIEQLSDNIYKFDVGKVDKIR